MTQYSEKSSVHLVARFMDVTQSESTKDAISQTLAHAEEEVQALFAQQDGLAESLDVGKIYQRHGFTNNSGWQQERPLFTIAEELFWEIPDGMDLTEAKNFLISFGAVSVMVSGAEEELPVIPHPAAMFLAEMDDDFIDIDADLLFSHPQDKKLLH